MRRSILVATMVRLSLALVFLAIDLNGQSSQSATTDKARLEAYLRYAEGFTTAVKLTIDDPTPTPFRNFSKLLVHVSLGNQTFNRTYYLSEDGKELIDGQIWNLGESPFFSTLQQLPAEGPSFGPANAKVTIVIFSDFQCPYCREFAKTIRQNIPKSYPNDVRVIFLDFPLVAIHPWARAMAEAAHCVAGDDNRQFWALHDWIFERQQEFTNENLKDKVLEYSKAQGLDAGKIGSCIDSHAAAPAVQRGIELGDKLEVQSTPAIFVNGRKLGGAQPWQTMDAVIKLELEGIKDVSGTAAGKNQ